MKLHVPDMSCTHCKTTIEQAVAGAGGTAQVSLETHEVTVEGLDPDRARQVIRDAGYDPRPA
ncbi:copper chaperone [Paracoccus isoporae]|uniref:Copper chaperone n=1 Tax=Paracoccus isoporae TaxID=591205 RepID=A0A1G7EUT5_9RHOB|nr:heavy-metal-associated domain-containing protein [Paracoccus isoporae]SDE67347.1 copper chaperone [Paracoccus isoporae]